VREAEKGFRDGNAYLPIQPHQISDHEPECTLRQKGLAVLGTSGAIQHLPPDESIQREHFAPPAQILYHLPTEGIKDFRPIPVGNAIPWEYLSNVASAPLGTWTIRCGDIVSVDLGHQGQDYAKVSDLRRLGDGRYIVVYMWLYTRDEIAQELQLNGRMSPSAEAHIKKMWPADSWNRYILSTNRTITLWDTAIEKASAVIANSLCQDSFYSTTSNSRRIVEVSNPRYKWMKNELLSINHAKIAVRR
jgi:hypothetical protein